MLAAVAEGDLQQRMTGPFAGSFAALQSNLNAATERLAELVGQITDTTGAVRRGAVDITAGAKGAKQGANAGESESDIDSDIDSDREWRAAAVAAQGV